MNGPNMDFDTLDEDTWLHVNKRELGGVSLVIFQHEGNKLVERNVRLSREQVMKLCASLLVLADSDLQ